MGVHRGVVEPGKLAAPGDFEEFGAVGENQGHAVAATQAMLVQQGCDPLAPLVQVAVRDGVVSLPFGRAVPPVRDDQCRRLGIPQRMVGDVHRLT